VTYRLLLLCLAAGGCLGQPLQLSRPGHAWEFADANGPRAGVFGTEQGTFEGYVYPLKVFRDLRLVFRSDNRVIPAASMARRIVLTQWFTAGMTFALQPLSPYQPPPPVG
jgi:hypothetical protein